MDLVVHARWRLHWTLARVLLRGDRAGRRELLVPVAGTRAASRSMTFSNQFAAWIGTMSLVERGLFFVVVLAMAAVMVRLYTRVLVDLLLEEEPWRDTRR